MRLRQSPKQLHSFCNQWVSRDYGPCSALLEGLYSANTLSLSSRFVPLTRYNVSRLENMEGKKMAIDSSIWLYQFQATMRDKEGRGLVNAHILGFLRRICKLLFYGIRPVFVFDGGAPALKKTTIVCDIVFA